MPTTNAFESPTAASRERLGTRIGGPKKQEGETTNSRRSPSIISSAEDAEIFERISQSTSVASSSSSKKDKLKVSASGGGAVGNMVGALANSFSPVSSPGSKTSEQRSDKVFSFRSSSKRDAAEAPKSNLDLRNNDNSFHVLASLLVDFFGKKMDKTDDCLTLLPEDRLTIQRLLPESARHAFIDAVRYRLELTPVVATTPLQLLTQQCKEFGLDEEDPKRNPILVANQLKDKPVSISRTPALQSPRDESDGKDDSGDDDDDDNRVVELDTSIDMSTEASAAKVSTERGEANTMEAVVSPTSTNNGVHSEDEEMKGAKSPSSTVLSDNDEAQSRQLLSEDDEETEQDPQSLAGPVLSDVFDPEKYAAARRVFSDDGEDDSEFGQFLRSKDDEEEEDEEEDDDDENLEAEQSEGDEKDSDDVLDQQPSTIEEVETEDGKTAEQQQSEIEEAQTEEHTDAGAIGSRYEQNDRSETTSVLAVADSVDAQKRSRRMVDPSAQKFESQSTRNSVLLNQTETSEIASSKAKDNQMAKEGQASRNDEQTFATRMSLAAGTFISDVRFLVGPTTTAGNTRLSTLFGQQETAESPGSEQMKDSPTFGSFFAGFKQPFAQNNDGTAGTSTGGSNIAGFTSDHNDTRGKAATSTSHEGNATTASTNESITTIGLISEKVHSDPSKSDPFRIDFAKYEEMNVADETEKQRLLTQLQEASAMLEQSETPETTQFWREHAMSLMHCLDGLAEDAYEKKASIKKDDASEKTKSIVTGAPATGSNAENMVVVPADSSRTSIPIPQASGLTPDFSDDKKRVEQQQSALAMDQVMPQEAAAYQRIRSYTEAQAPETDVPMVDVVAPADLPAGYHFEAEIEGQRFLATVPSGGVQQGETFTCYMRELDSVAIDIPVGYWKDGLCDIFSHGCCHPVVGHSLFCPLIALGQIQQRISLDFLGRPRFGDEGMSNRAMVLTVVGFWTLTNLGLFAVCNLKWFHGLELSIADVIAIVMINIAMFGFIVFVTQSTRSSLREKFMIREERCFDLEDLFCATVCLPCTVGQMARHTANYDDYEAVCCSKTGLPKGVRVNQNYDKEVDGYVV